MTSSRFYKEQSGGFSLIEVLVVIGVLAVLAIATLPSLFGGSGLSDLNNATNEIVAVARQAQNQSATGARGVVWGIHFSNSGDKNSFFALFLGSTYSSSSQTYYHLPVTIGYVSSTLSVGSTTDVTFAAISGVASASTTIKLYVISNPSLISTINIASSGEVFAATPSSAPLRTAQDIYVLDTGNDHVVEYDTNGNYISKFGSSGTGNGQFKNPVGIAIDNQGNIYVNDQYYVGQCGCGNDRIQKFDSNGNYILTFATGTWNYNGITGFDYPSGMAVGPNGDIYALDAWLNFLDVFTPTGTLIADYNVPQISGFTYNPNPGYSSIAIASSGNVYFADSGNGIVQEFDENGNFINSFSNHLGYPIGIALDSSGNVWVLNGSVQGSNRLVEFDPNGNYLTNIPLTLGSASGQVGGRAFLAVGSDGNFYISDIINDRVEKFSSSGVFIASFNNIYPDATLTNSSSSAGTYVPFSAGEIAVH